LSEFINNPLQIKLIGGPLDGDQFELIPLGSIIPPMRVSYASRGIFNGIEKACWVIYQHQSGIVEWPQETAYFDYVGLEPM